MDLQSIAQWIVSHSKEIGEWYLISVGVASWIVKTFPVLKADHWLLPAIKFIGRWALNKSVTDESRPL